MEYLHGEEKHRQRFMKGFSGFMLFTLDFLISKACCQVIIDKTTRLHVCIDHRTAGKPEAALDEVFA